MKKLFVNPEMEVLHFEAVDIITASGSVNGDLDQDETPPIVVG
jgi:hypothetical protein